MNPFTKSTGQLEELTIGEIRRALAQGGPRRRSARRWRGSRRATRPIADTNRSRRATGSTWRRARSTARPSCRKPWTRSPTSASAPVMRGRTGRLASRPGGPLASRRRGVRAREPRLEFEAWIEAGAPERYRAEGPVARAEGLLRRFGSPRVGPAADGIELSPPSKLEP
jgi:hypothetical protein